jgi:conjugal transfer pilus assembly protein TraW
MIKKGMMPLLFFSSVTMAADLGNWGEAYPIHEQDMLAFIRQKLKNMETDGTLAREQDAIKKRVIANTRRPPPVQGLGVADKESVHYVDPTFVVSESLADHKGHVFAKQGDNINPLLHVPFNQTLYFIDGDDKRQLAWLKQQRSTTLNDKIILVNGDIKDTSDSLQSRIYFDQYGVLSQKFQLNAVPARVTLAEDKQRLRVDIFSLEPSKEP